MKIISEMSLRDFRFWSGAKDTAAELSVEQLDQVERVLKDLYPDVEHIDDMEGFKEDFEDELGMPITNKEGLPHYTFMCWLCYEELAHRIAQELWPDKF